ncbi:MAG: hypothetical protein U0587_20090 [Candidatus Binatia bacterium]
MTNALTAGGFPGNLPACVTPRCRDCCTHRRGKHAADVDGGHAVGEGLSLLEIAQTKKVEWTLRIAVCGEFFGHGTLAVFGKQSFIDLLVHTIFIGPERAKTLVVWIGALDLLVAAMMLFAPWRIVLVWGTTWGLLTAVARPWAAAGKAGAIGPFFGTDFLEFVERFANVGAPLALLYVRGLPKTVKEWFQ